MTGFLAVLRRELVERRLLALASLVGLFPFLLPLLPGGDRAHAAEVRSVAALALAAVVGGVLAFLLGGSVIGRDLAERRLGFYFARPLAGGSIWGGKLAAAFLLAIGAAALVLLPTAIVDGMGNGGFRQAWTGGPAALLFAPLALAVLVVAADVVGRMARSRSPWLVLDLAGLAAFAALVWTARRRLILAGANNTFISGHEIPLFAIELTVAILVPAALLAMAAASAVAVIRARTDPRRGHRLLSLTLWTILLASALAFQAFSLWEIDATPADLTAILETRAAPAGSWIALSGSAAHRNGYVPRFLLDLGSGRFVRTFSFAPYPWWHSSEFSGDGRRAAWLEPEGVPGRPPFHLVTADLALPGPPVAHRPIVFDSLPQMFVLSADGSRFAVDDRGRLMVFDLESGRILASLPLARNSWPAPEVRFLGPRSPGLLRVFEIALREPFYGPDGAGEVVIFDLDLATGRRSSEIRIPGGPAFPTWAVSPDGGRIVLRQGDRKAGPLVLFDAATGRRLADLSTPDTPAYADFLADGRVAVVSRQPAGRDLTIFGPDGQRQRGFQFAARAVVLGGQPARDRLVVATTATNAERENPTSWTSRLLDLATGRERALGSDLIPIADPSAAPASAASRLFHRAGRGLVSLDPVTGKETTVLRTRG